MFAETDKIRQIFADALNLDVAEVNPNSNLVDDLGAESIDFLDITFQLESEYAIRIPKGEIIALAQAGLSEDEFAVSGVVSEKGLENLKSPTLALDTKKLSPGMKMQSIPETFTVQTFINLVERQLAKVESKPLKLAKA
jgi:acyl carrier protein